MPGQNQQTTNQTQLGNTTTNPWAPAIPALTNLLTQVGNISPAVTPAQTSASTNLLNSTSAIPNFGGAGTDAVKNLFSSSTTPEQNLALSSFANLSSQMSPYTNPNYINPMTNPEMQTVLDQIAKSATSGIEGQFAAAGRDPLGNADATKNIAKAIAAGEAPALLSQYNTNVGQAMGAGQAVQQAGASTANELSALQQLPLQNQIAALSAAGEIPGLMTAPATNQLNAANIQYGQPFQNLTQLEQMLLPIGSMGSQGTGNQTGTSTTVQPQSTLSNVLGGSLGLLGMMAMFSDIRLKDDVEPIGLLYNGLPFYRFRYIDDPEEVRRVGVMAQDVEEVMPEAVGEVAGFKTVDYDAVTRSAAQEQPMMH